MKYEICLVVDWSFAFRTAYLCDIKCISEGSFLVLLFMYVYLLCGLAYLFPSLFSFLSPLLPTNTSQRTIALDRRD